MTGALLATAATAAIPLVQRQIIDNVIVTQQERSEEHTSELQSP